MGRVQYCEISSRKINLSLLICVKLSYELMDIYVRHMEVYVSLLLSICKAIQTSVPLETRNRYLDLLERKHIVGNGIANFCTDLVHFVICFHLKSSGLRSECNEEACYICYEIVTVYRTHTQCVVCVSFRYSNKGN